MRWMLTVVVPEERIFDAYWYGVGEVREVRAAAAGGLAYVVDYGDDEYRARYQCDRFLSGLYWASVAAIAP